MFSNSNVQTVVFIHLINFYLKCITSFLGIEHILLRGARLKHTEWIYGVVLYTGHETKLLLNSSAAPIKLYRSMLIAH